MTLSRIIESFIQKHSIVDVFKAINNQLAASRQISNFMNSIHNNALEKFRVCLQVIDSFACLFVLLLDRELRCIRISSIWVIAIVQ